MHGRQSASRQQDRQDSRTRGESHDLRNRWGLAQATSAKADGQSHPGMQSTNRRDLCCQETVSGHEGKVVSGGSGSELRGDTSPRPAVAGNRQSNTHTHNRPAAVNSGTSPSTGPQIPWVHADAPSQVSVACQVAKSVP